MYATAKCILIFIHLFIIWPKLDWHKCQGVTSRYFPTCWKFTKILSLMPDTEKVQIFPLFERDGRFWEINKPFWGLYRFESFFLNPLEYYLGLPMYFNQYFITANLLTATAHRKRTKSEFECSKIQQSD